MPIVTEGEPSDSSNLKEPTEPSPQGPDPYPPLVPPQEPPGWYAERARLRAEIQEMKARIIEAKTIEDAKAILYRGKKP